MRHIAVVPQGGDTTPVDDALASAGLEREVVAWTPYFAVAPLIAAADDLVLTIQQLVANAVMGLALAAGLPRLCMVPSPVNLRPAVIHQFWHGRADDDPPNRWIRSIVNEALGQTRAHERL